ncbi:hypothetical protein Pd630_LPD01020 [Rhodococcus opacus PD630]|nr:hypothetical protein Pd630_LPD01020 [Rhodococcus opacus PD630]
MSTIANQTIVEGQSSSRKFTSRGPHNGHRPPPPNKDTT